MTIPYEPGSNLKRSTLRYLDKNEEGADRVL
jgi:hypothetical protein